MEVDYHAEIGFPEADFPTGEFDLTASSHAARESSKDRYGGFDLPESVELTQEMYERDPREATASQEGETTVPHVFEITIDGGPVRKLGLRLDYDDERDLVLIIRPFEGTIVTAWINVKGDPHETLDDDEYAVPL